jgi:hypothetical protein
MLIDRAPGLLAFEVDKAENAEFVDPPPLNNRFEEYRTLSEWTGRFPVEKDRQNFSNSRQ